MVLLADNSTTITPIILSSTLSRMAAKNFSSASGNAASHFLWCECGEFSQSQQAWMLSVTGGQKTGCVGMHACLCAEIQVRAVLEYQLQCSFPVAHTRSERLSSQTEDPPDELFQSV